MPGSTTRRARRTVFQRLVIAGNILAIVGFLIAAAVLGYGYEKFGQIPRVEIADYLSAPSETANGVVAQNYLLVGVDSAAGLDPEDPVRASRGAVSGLRSDTVMVLRVDPASTRAALLSIPRDLYVPIAGTRGSAKINSAVQVGGPEGLIATIKNYFGIPINHYVQVDFFGFGKLVDALDGVPVYFPHPVRDLKSGLSIPEAGCITLDSHNALGFVRSRAVPGVHRRAVAHRRHGRPRSDQAPAGVHRRGLEPGLRPGPAQPGDPRRPDQQRPRCRDPRRHPRRQRHLGPGLRVPEVPARRPRPVRPPGHPRCRRWGRHPPAPDAGRRTGARRVPQPRSRAR